MKKKLQVNLKIKQIKTAGVYDRWLHTLGGGEQVAFAYAETLRDLGYETEILTHRKVDIHEAERKMDVDLHDIKITYLPDLPDYQLSEYTQKYDVFVSNSFLDYIPNRSKLGILSVFFPSRIKISLYEYLKRSHIVPSLRRFFVYPSWFEGFRYDEFVRGKLHKWMGRESTVYFNQPVNDFQLEIWIEYLAFSCIDRIHFRVGEKEIIPQSKLINQSTNSILYTFHLRHSVKDNGITIALPDSEYSNAIALTSLRIISVRYMLYNLFKTLFPSWEMRLHGGPSSTRFSDIDSYDRILSISQFTKKWVAKYWGLGSDLLYPPVNVHAFHASTQKKNIIAHVGRFFVGGHSKKQLDLVRVFRRMVDKGLKDWELHLVGGVADGSTHRQYLSIIGEEIRGYPIVLHQNAPFQELRQVLSDAKIYWHATGLDEDVNRHPIRLEHFGITTVEAMASGCVPVVINCGGQPEIVKFTKCGYVWNTREELIEKTMSLIHNPKLLNEQRKLAIEKSKYFSRERFEKELEAYLCAQK